MLRQSFLPILIFMLMDYSCKCQDLEKFVAPILNQNMAPLMAIVDTTNISSHIVRSIEMPIRAIINSTVEFKYEKLKEDVNSKFDALQQKMDEHMGDNRNQLTEVKQDIATLRKEMEEVKKFATAISTENKDIAEKLKGLIATVNSRVALSACVASAYTAVLSSAIKLSEIKTSEGITNQHLTSFKSSGVFVCEVPGLYYIYVVILSQTKSANVKISKNSIELINVNTNNYYNRFGYSYQSNSAIVVTELQKGDTIDIKPSYKDMYIYGSSNSCLTIVKVK
ncbi:uncharacterized protein LOC134684055 [Mytilus trossulus]|uniref:uncharacterized protein LOC134684055 n=1 Tax=Mytilus trossulus TaxID=6551 RepID=UPI003004C137